MLRKRSIIALLSIFLLGGSAAVLLALVFAPALVGSWINWTARRDHLAVSWRAIEVPLFRPIVLHDVTVRGTDGAAPGVSLDVKRAEFGLRITAFFSAANGRPLRHLVLAGVRGEITNPLVKDDTARLRLQDLRKLLADRFRIDFDALRIVRGDVSVTLKEATLSANELEAGRFVGSEFTVLTPWFTKSFPGLQGTTSWQQDHLTIGAIALMRGLDLDAVTFDLEGLQDDRIGTEINLDAFGGKVRASIAAGPREWDVAGTATQVSLSQATDALGFFNRASGSIRSSKFTFRGEPAKIAEATASVWAEAAGFTWRDRTADTIMIGASLSNRQIQIEQIYVKQHANEVTLSGESALPRGRFEWPDLRGDVSASIKDLGDLARLFGGKAADFNGEIEVNGNITERAHKLGGQLRTTGRGLTLFGATVEKLSGRFALTENTIGVEEFELHHDQDFVSARGDIDLAKSHRATGHLAFSAANLAPYARLIRWFGGDTFAAEGCLSGEATASPTVTDFTLDGRSLRLNAPWATLPLDLRLEGSYSAESVFLRNFSLRNEGAALSSELTIGPGYLHLQALQLQLHGRAVIEGSLFLPVRLARTTGFNFLIEGPLPHSVFDVDLRLAGLDLAELASALSPDPALAGIVDGNVQLYGATENPTAHFQGRARDVRSADRTRFSGEINGSVADGKVTGESHFAFAPASPSAVSFTLPFAFATASRGYRFRADAELGLQADLHEVPLDRIPLLRGVRAGFLQGNLTASGTWQRPSLNGEAEVRDLRAMGNTLTNARVRFEGPTAKISAGRFNAGDSSISFAGEADFSDSANATFSLRPDAAIAFKLPMPEGCVQQISLERASPETDARRASLFQFRGPLFAAGWTLTLSDSANPDDAETSIAWCADAAASGGSLILQIDR